MKVQEIVKSINDQGGFDNFRKWKIKTIATWVRVNYDCDYNTSIDVAKQIS